MTKISIDQIKKVRAETGAPVVEIKRALEASGGDEERAREALRKSGFERAAKKAGRPVGAGIVETYIHHTRNSGATVVLQSETDFVARNPEFAQLAREIAMQGTATPVATSEELLQQPWIRDETKTIKALIDEKIAKFGENIKLTDYKPFKVK